MPQTPLEDSRPTVPRLAGILKASPAMAVLVPSLLAFNAAQMASLTIRPFSKHWFRKINRWAADTWWGWSVSLAERAHGTSVVFSGDEIPARENAIVVANHQQMPDITYLMFLAREKGRLGDMKWFVKAPIKYVPGVGWGMAFLDCLFVERDWTADRSSIERTFESLVQGDVPVWLISFVEGTRITPRKLAASQAYATAKGLQPTQHVMVPRTKGFVATVTGLRNHVAAVYDVTIGYPDGVPTMWQYIKGASRKAHLHVRRYPIAELPEGEEAISAWLIERYNEKDDLLEHFYSRGAFPDPK